jgi:sterol desaturase/sphingolipid hydroxylase (fatty acid hydroxylase superfamily)
MREALETYLRENQMVALSTPLYVVLIALEVVMSQYRKLGFYSLPETLINVWLNVANTALGLAVKGAVVLFMASLSAWSLPPVSEPALYWFLLFVGLDLCFYFEHRSEHFCRVLWAVHVTHHSSVEFNLTTGFRSSVFRPLVSVWFFLPLVILGFRPADILLMDAICQIYGILVHTRFVRQMPAWFEAVFVSPSHHRVHHASNVEYLDRNMGMVLIVWDRLFGTFQQELPEVPPVYGLTKNPERPYHPFRIIFHEWAALWNDLRQPIGWGQRLRYLFAPPGWRHDGRSSTSRQMRENRQEQS